MKGLLLKDFYTLAKQMKIFFLLIVVWSCIPGFYASSFAIVYAAMLPVTVLAYDERSKWDSLAAMMPYTKKDLVISKYVLGYLSVVGAALLALIAQSVIALITKTSIEPERYFSIPLVVAIALILQALNLPVMFWLGVEKGRYAFFALIALVAGGGAALSSKMIHLFQTTTANFTILILGAIAATIIINVLSILFATKIYKSKVH